MLSFACWSSTENELEPSKEVVLTLLPETPKRMFYGYSFSGLKKIDQDTFPLTTDLTIGTLHFSYRILVKMSYI